MPLVSEVLAAAAEGSEPAVDGGGLSGALQAAVVRPLRDGLEAGLRERLAALTLEDLLRRVRAAGLKRPAAEPLDSAT